MATTDLGPTDPEARYGFTPQLRDVELDGRLTIDGHVQVLQMTGRGSLRVAAGAALHGPYDGFGLDSSVVLDAVDVAGTLDARLIGLGGSGTLDASGGLLALGSAVNTLGIAFSSRMTVDGNLRLGDWANGGAEARDDPLGNPDPFERVDVSGTLDLTAARLLYDPVRVYYDSAADVFDPPLPPPTLADSFVIVTYGNRVGAFPRDRLDVLLDDGVDFADILVPGRIVYTSGENDGPGEVLVVLPEPATATPALAGCLLLGRRR